MPKPTALRTDAKRDGTSPILIVAGTLVTVVMVTFLLYSVGDYEDQEVVAGGTANLAGPASVGACGQGTPADSSYSVNIESNPDPPRPEGTTFLLTVRHDGKAVAGAKVCLTADMPEMQHPGINNVARVASGGRYEARLQFGMGGSWRTSVTIAEPGKAVVSVPLRIQVSEVAPN
jgi:hypothetical protein